MELILLMSLGLAALLVPLGSDRSDDSSDPQDPEEPESVKIGSDFTRDDAGNVTGTQGADRLTYQDYLASIEAGHAGAGNDPEGLIEGITAGAGNDTIDLMRDESQEELLWADGDEQVHGGSGDDVIRLSSPYGVEIYGGAGRDDILVGSNPSDPVSVFGGSGHDTLDGTLMDNGYLHGDGGDDTFQLSHAADFGAGYAKIDYGGAGDDVLNVDASIRPAAVVMGGTGSTGNHDFHGGEGRDSLVVTVNEGLFDDDLVLENGQRMDDYVQASQESDEPGIVRIQSIEFADFVKGQDRITLNVSSVNDNFDLSEIRMEEQSGDDGEAKTVITASYVSDTFLTREVSVTVRAVGLNWEDIEMRGYDPTCLAPVVRLS